MAILDKNKNNFVVDRQENTFVGLKLPLALEGGDISSTKTTLEAIKQNIKNLCSTELGERVMQPNLGVKLKKFLFEPFNENVVLQIQEIIDETINHWLPFVLVNDIQVNMSDSERSTMNISIIFSLKRDPKKYESIQINVGE